MWTCIECEFKFSDDNGDSEERMCESCLNKEETEKRENELMKEEITITKEKVRQWLGTSNQLEEAIEVIYEIAIGEYSTEMLNQDIIEYYMGNWEYKEGNNEEK